MIFCFCYLFFLQGEVLAEAQFVFSKGATTYNIFVGAIITTLILQIVQWVVGTLSRLPSTVYALSYIPSILLLAFLVNINEERIAQFSLGAWVWIIPVVLVVYILLAIAIHALKGGSMDSDFDLKSQIYPNFILLFLQMLVIGFVPQSSDVYHYELKAERLILAGDYEAVSRVGERSLRASARLTQLRMYALSQQGLLAERLFEYPQYDGARGLLDISDTLSVYRFSTQSICRYLGAQCGKNVKSTDRFYQLLLGEYQKGDTVVILANEHTIDYYLCSLLLEKKLKEWRRELPHYYNLSDSIPHAYDALPKSYREALLLIGNPQEAFNGKIVIGSDTLATLTDREMIAQFRDYQALKAELKDPVERVNKTHREFGKTYWWYYDSSHLATGELEKRK
ncbi:MAG: hypothetical protein J5616_06160 [Bacteroidaceae bacterium]|nr:hypothetical protein [Bacteroidaceae bacterium]